jgi:hypothetical protein
MKWCIVLVASCCAAASAQMLAQNTAPKLEPYQLKALENALRSPKAPAANNFSSPFANLPSQTTPLALSPKQSMLNEVAKACAIPLRSVSGDPKIDPGIQRKMGPEAFSSDHMPVAKGLPPCPQDRQPAH